jgi:hypothetical protein
MKIINKNIRPRLGYIYIICFGCLSIITSCKKFVQVPLPSNSISGSAAFLTDQSSAAVMNNIFGYFSEKGTFDGDQALGYYTGLYTDELTPVTSNGVTLPFYSDAIQSGNASSFWSQFYQQIATTNVAIEQLPAQTKLLHKNQWLGEAYFMRAFMFSYLVNLYGDVPLALTSDYKVNNNLSKSAAADVYKQIIADLKQAQGLLPNAYLDANGDTTSDRSRPNGLTATALLARVYLYSGDYPGAEAQATTLINNANLQLTALDQTFLANSNETIWGLAKEANGTPPYVRDYNIFDNATPAVISGQLSAFKVEGVLSPQLISAFESGDKRLGTWARIVHDTNPVIDYYLVNKYTSNVNNTEYIMIFRQAEQYLIRAEARARQNNLNGAAADLDVLRSRAGLAGITVSDQTNMLSAVLHERQVEMFTELGARFFDLKRLGAIDAVMTTVAPLKGGKWSSYMQLWPILTQDIQIDPNLKQNPGYN